MENKNTKVVTLSELIDMSYDLPMDGAINFSCEEDADFWAIRKIEIFDGPLLVVGSYGGGLTCSLDIRVDGGNEEIRSFLSRVLHDYVAGVVYINQDAQSSTYWNRVDTLHKEITAEIIDTITSHNLTEVEIYDEEGDNVSVMWFDRYDDIHDTAVEKVRIEDRKIELVVESSDCGNGSVTLCDYDFALRNVSWLAQILDAVKEKLTPKTE